MRPSTLRQSHADDPGVRAALLRAEGRQALLYTTAGPAEGTVIGGAVAGTDIETIYEFRAWNTDPAGSPSEIRWVAGVGIAEVSVGLGGDDCSLLDQRYVMQRGRVLHTVEVFQSEARYGNTVLMDELIVRIAPAESGHQS